MSVNIVSQRYKKETHRRKELNSAISGFASFLLQRYAISPKLQNIIGGEREIAGVVSVQGRFCSRDGEIGGFVSMDGLFCS